jgi:chromosome segregation protein
VFLRSLTIRGFKSFADKTTLEFTPGVSVIVGPNGSGKSNIADAIAWVLGEQGPRALRGGQMADVIFAGSPNRPALGIAEVSLVIDNTAGLIPVPASEIEISRTIYRSGESEYRLGGRPCRLLDIQELLSDTGMGRALHTIIGQGNLDEVLQARPEDRRQFVEEAAGIAKHRRRRERAERKLAGLEQDLLRLQDVVGELRRQLKPLKQQAELAGRHDQLTKEAADIASKLAAARLAALYRDRDRRSPSWREAEARQAAARTRLAALSADIERLDTELAAAEERQRHAEELHAASQAAKSEAEDRLRTAMRGEGQARERLSAAVNRSGRLFALEEELRRTEAALTDVQGSLAGRERELEDAEREFRRLDQDRRDAEEERRRLSERAATHRAEADALQRAVAAQDEERTKLSEALTSIGERLDRASSRAEELAEAIERLDAAETPLAAEQVSLQRERTALAVKLADEEAQEKGLLARQEVIDGQERELAESPGSAFVRRRGALPIGMLRELIEAPAELHTVVKAALGPFADAVVYSNERDLMEEAQAEGVAGLVLALANGGPLSAWARGEGSLPKQLPLPVERRLLGMVRPDPRIRGLAGALLGDVYLARSFAEAQALHRVHPNAQFVTPEGLVVGPAFVRAASGHDARVDAVRRRSAAIERDLAAVRRRTREGRQRVRAIDARVAALTAQLEGTDGEITVAAEEAAGLEAERAALRREEEILEERLASVQAGAATARQRLAMAPPDVAEPPVLPPMPEPPVHLRVEVEALRRERSRLDAGVARARRDMEALAAEDPVQLRQALAEAEGEREAADEALRDAGGNLDGALAAYRASTEEARRAHAADAEANRAWREQAAAADRLREEHEQEDRARLDLERRIGEAERVLREGHAAEPAEAVASLDPADMVEDLQRRSDLVARRLGLLGRVNLLASGELESIKERHDFLVRELEDVRGARRDLQDLIADVDRQVAELFQEAFHDVAAEFADLFALMFPGGEGRLTLTDPADPLASGIEVEARPGRKRVKRLSLLSGGERSLAALAFLFAIFKARPSPFYLMDEVEAALDDVNLVRLLGVIEEFARASQILVVTHQKRTMEAADVLYGVSMGAGGVSKVIVQRLAEVGAAS